MSAPYTPPPNGQQAGAAGSQSDLFEEVFGSKRDLLAERLTLMLLDLGGLTYEMAVRNHFRLDVLIQQASAIQTTDAELGQVDRLLRLGQAGAAGDCPNCGGLYARGAAFCSQCGFELVKADELNSEPHVAQPQASPVQELERSTQPPPAPRGEFEQQT